MTKSHYTYGLATTKGSERKVNQDSATALIWSYIPRFNGENVGLFIVGDGMGGSEVGLKASQLAIQVVSQEIRADLLEQSDVSISLIMTAAVQEANRQVIAASNEAGTTLTAVLVIGNQTYIAHVGETRAYYVYGDQVTQLTEIHDYVHLLISHGYITWEDIEAGHHVRNVLYRALGQTDTLDVDIVTQRLEPNSYLVLCSNGLWVLDGKREETDALSVIQSNPPQLACEKLTELSQMGGSTDDISVIVIQIN